MEKSFVIAHIAPPQPPVTGDFVYRVLQPDRALGRVDGFSVISFMNLSPHRERILRDADLLIVQMLGDPDILPTLYKRKNEGKPTVFEVSDNFFEFQPSNPARGFYENPEMQILLLQLLSRADAVQFTTPELAKRFSTFNDTTATFSNQIENVPPLPDRPASPIVVGWGGSLGHLDDMRAIAPSISEWLIRTPGVLLSIMGPKQIFDLFSKAPADRKKHVEYGSLEEYFKFLETLHVGIASLKDDPFNLCRSDVKFIEYASRGVVPICSRLSTYTDVIDEGFNGFMFDGQDEFVGTLDKLCRNPELLSSVSKNARDYVARERTEQLHAEKRARFYQRMLSSASPESNQLWEWVTSLNEARTSTESRHCFLEFSHIEKLLYAGMELQFRAGRPADAVRYFQAAAAEAPDFYLPHLYTANSLRALNSTQSIEHCRKAIKLAPHSPAAALALAEITNASSENEQDAIQKFKECTRRFPCHASAWLRLASMQKTAGLENDSGETLKQALEAEPLNFIAAASLTTHLIESAEYNEAEELLKKLVNRYTHVPSATTMLLQDTAKSDKPELAASVLLDMLKKKPQDQSLLWELIKTCNKIHDKGKTEIAISYLNGAFSIFPENPELIYRMGRLQQKSGDTAGARESWNKLLSMPGVDKYHQLVKSELKKME